MDHDYKRLTNFLVGLDIDKVPHTQKNYLAHLIAVYKLMESEGCTPELCRAGMFHSIYGTQQFQGFKIPLADRPRIRELIGHRAEKLAYLNCAMLRETFDAVVHQVEAPFCFQDRLTGEMVALDRVDFDDLCRVHLYDWLEQVPRSQYGRNYRGAAYRGMALRLGLNALAAYDRVFAQLARDMPE